MEAAAPDPVKPRADRCRGCGRQGEGGGRGEGILRKPCFCLSLPPPTGRGVFPFQEYIDAHPETIVLDPLPAIRTLLDRSKSYELIRKIEAYMKGTDARGSAPAAGAHLDASTAPDSPIASEGDRVPDLFKPFGTGST